ncbi:O-methyltransferase [Brevibacillus laterosporus]|uniref:O-methyltransferase n=1 Tax=Brevibacillus laterosporus TaxID=1465 RepID=UPI00037BF176|nr:O-methyltransferase [Brevibacillus laterosporus]ATO48296.1 methyltransferase [Brevibacillus laterosporus DSM 25]MBG9804316.1 methyltransferase [Brevibacillus laterosporus]MED2005893.1 O-methyltransferase [Brevibacillus laterosporus]MED4764598.1 O-methyltransferase [Brevibacillus laterosporus]TPH12691.1 O-methyltransferase [Brevibacillus laterosporus]
MESPKKWTEVDQYFNSMLLPSDPILDVVLQANAKAGMPAIDVAPNQGKLLYLLAKIRGAKKILEIGTLGGYSSIWLARALPQDGQLISLEYEQSFAHIAEENVKKAGLAEKVSILVGPALETLPTLQEKGMTGFDMVFIDADKQNNPHYLQWALKLCNPGAIILGDNVVRDGEVIHPESEDDRIQGIRQFIDLLSSEPRIESTAIQTVGSKGYDGFVLGVVKE